MQILALNCGSSSVKYKLIDAMSSRAVASGKLERVGRDVRLDDALSQVFSTLSTHPVDAVGHRVVHGGEEFTGSVLITDRVIAEVEEIGQLPQMQGINIFSLDNQGDSVKDSLSDLLNAGLFGGLLAILVLYFFLRQVSTTLIVTAAVPFSLLITLGALYFFGLTLNILSMMGLMLAVGMLVDNAVVITESIFRHRSEDKERPLHATIKGVHEVGLAVIAGTTTTVIVFAPIIFGTKADIMVFLTHVAITIIVALLASLLIAQTLVPMLAERVAVPPRPKPSGMMMRLTRRYERGLGWVVAWDKPAFRGREAALAERERGIARRLVGIATDGRRPARAARSPRPSPCAAARNGRGRSAPASS